MSAGPCRLEVCELRSDQRELEPPELVPTNTRRGLGGRNPESTHRGEFLARPQLDWLDPRRPESRLAPCVQPKAACQTCESEPGTRPPSLRPCRESRGSKKLG